MIILSERCLDFVKSASQGSVHRIFLFLALNQPPKGGFKCSRRFLANELQLQRTTVGNALKYLSENLLVHESITCGQTEFMVNPYYVIASDDNQARINDWSSRIRGI